MKLNRLMQITYLYQSVMFNFFFREIFYCRYLLYKCNGKEVAYLKDQEIVELFFERSEQAIDCLTVRYGAAIRSVSSGILKDPQDVDECVNDTYLQIWNSIPPHRPQYLGAFACRIARNISLNRYDFNSAEKRNGYFDAALDELAGCIPDITEVESEYSANEIAETINSFLAGLSQSDRFLFVQRYWLGASISQLSEKSKLTEHAVSVRLFRLRKKLKKHLRKEGVII